MLYYGESMADIFGIRNLDKKTKVYIYEYAQDHKLNMAEALRDLVFFGLQHIKHTQKEKKYSSIFDVYGKLKFSAEPDLSQKIDKVVYDEE